MASTRASNYAKRGLKRVESGVRGVALRTGGPDLRPLARVKWDRSRIALMVLGRLGTGMEDDFIRMEFWGMMEKSLVWEGDDWRMFVG